MKKANANATHTEPTLEVTQNLGEGVTAKTAAKTTEQLHADVVRELEAVNTAIKNGQDPTETLTALKNALTALNKRLMRIRIGELSGLDVVELYREYIPNPFAMCKGARPNKDTGLYGLVDVEKYVPFEALDAANPTRKITQRGEWQKMVRILRYNMVLFAVRDNGNAHSNISLTADDFSFRKSIGWDKQPSMNSLTSQLTELAAAILPPELCPKVMYKGDAKQLLHAITPEAGVGHETRNVVKREATFEQKLFAVVHTRMENGGYLFDDDAKEAAAKASAKNDGKVVNPTEEKPEQGETEAAQAESAEN